MTNLDHAFSAFDEYHRRDPETEVIDGVPWPKELLYAVRMTDRLNTYAPSAPEHVQLAARCQHIGRWEIPRSLYPEGRTGYLQWRSKLLLHHADLAGRILSERGFDAETISRVKFLLQKKELRQHHPDTQLLEDVVCLVFIEHYLGEFSAKHPEEKVTEIVRKTAAKMSARALATLSKLELDDGTRIILDRLK